jgi:hypothetical protein
LAKLTCQNQKRKPGGAGGKSACGSSAWDGMPSRSRACIYANPSQDFAKLTKMQSPFAKPLYRSFVDFFAKIGMQSPFAKPLELLC